VAVQPLSNVVGNGVPPPHMPATGGGHVLLPQVVPASHALPLATHLRLPGSQQPLPQSAPLQQASPGPPQLTHWPSLQARPEALHDAPAQHGWPGPPQTAQMPLSLPPVQASPPLVQLRPEQHGWPASPHATQVVWFAHVAPPAVQVVVVPPPPPCGTVQHAWPTAPQLPQLPLPHAMLLEQLVPEPTQTRFTQQPPELHSLPAQQG